VDEILEDIEVSVPQQAGVSDNDEVPLQAAAGGNKDTETTHSWIKYR